MPAPHVAGSENLVNRGAITLCVGGYIAVAVQPYAKIGQQPLSYGMQKSHGQQNQIGLKPGGAVFHFLHGHAPVLVRFPFQTHNFHPGNAAVFSLEMLGSDAPVPFAAFLLR